MLENIHFIIVQNKDGSFNLIASENGKVLETYFPGGSQKPRKFFKVTGLEEVEAKVAGGTDEPKEEVAEGGDVSALPA